MVEQVDGKWSQGKYLNFFDDGKCDAYKAKTLVFVVTSRVTSANIGVIKWYSSWRKYTFQPVNDSVLDAACMRDIADFCELKTNERKATWKPTRVPEPGPRFVAKLVRRSKTKQDVSGIS